MNNQEIVDNAPEGATHIDGEHNFCKAGYYFDSKLRWWIPSEFIGGSRSLADIKRIAELENHIQSLKVINEYIDEGCPDMQVVRSEVGEVISRAEGTYLKPLKEQE